MLSKAEWSLLGTSHCVRPDHSYKSGTPYVLYSGFSQEDQQIDVQALFSKRKIGCLLVVHFWAMLQT